MVYSGLSGLSQEVLRGFYKGQSFVEKVQGVKVKAKGARVERKVKVLLVEARI